VLQTPGKERDVVAASAVDRENGSPRGCQVARWKRPAIRIALAPLALVAAIATVGGLAVAGNGVLATFGSSGSGDGQLSDARGVAVNTTSGAVYVADSANQRIEQFDADGTFASAWGWGVQDGSEALQACTSGCTAGIGGGGAGQLNAPHGIAVNQVSGDVYVLDRENLRVEQFGADGDFIRAWGWGVTDGTDAFQVCEMPGPCQSGTAGSGDGQLAPTGASSGIAVDPSSGAVYVADPGNGRVQKFSAVGSFLTTFGVAGSGDGQFGPDSPDRIAVDSTGDVYANDPGNLRIQRFAGTGAFETVFGTDFVGEPAAVDIAIDPTENHIFILKGCTSVLCPDNPATPDERRVFELDDAGVVLDSHMARAGITSTSGLGVNHANDRIYVASWDQVYLLGAVDPPTGTISVSNVTAHGATFEATINPQGTPTSYHFEYSIDGSAWTRATYFDTELGAGNSDIGVSFDVIGLKANTQYQVRLVATKPLGNPGVTLTTAFTTDAEGPRIAMASTTSSAERATLRARIDPQATETTYRFEYGLTSDYGATTSVAIAGAGSGFTRVAQQITGLTSNTTYHFRLVVSSAAGEAVSPDRTVTTGPGLPDGRRYELVSPVQKFGGDVMVDSGRTRTSRNGDAVQFTSLAGFGDVRGTGIATEYVSQRDPDSGWSTHAITPLQKPQTFLRIIIGGLDPRYMGESSDDLDAGVFLSNRLLTGEGANVADVPNLYLRRDLRTPGPGEYELLTDAAQPNELAVGPSYKPWFAGASDDFTHLLFSSVLRLTPDAPVQPADCFAPPFLLQNPCQNQLYEWIDGEGLRLVGVLPESEGGGLAAQSIAGQARNLNIYAPHVISRDGSRIFFTEQAGTDTRDGRLYLRENGTTTIRINVSERTSPSDENPAMYWDASEDGSVAYFTTREPMTDDDTNAEIDLYRWEREAPVGARLTRISVDEQPADEPSDVDAVVGTSADGDYVYFMGGSQLVASAPPRPATGDLLLFAWHAGRVSFVGTVGDLLELAAPTGWGGSLKAGRVTPDGKHLLFTSRSKVGLTDHDNGDSVACPFGGGGGGCNEVYIYSADANDGAGALACASCEPDGARAQTNANIMHRVATGGSSTGPALPRALSNDGRRAFFTTGERLAPEDRNGHINDVYVYDIATGELDLISSGRSESHSYFLGASASGDDVFFATRERLVASDVDSSYDLYDARVGGGFHESVPPPRCVEDRCRGSVDAAPVAPQLSGSLLFEGPNQAFKASPKFHARSLTLKQLRRLARGVPVRLSVRVSQAGRVRVLARAHIDGKRRIVASSTKRAQGRGIVTLRLSLSRAALAELTEVGKLRLLITTRFLPVAGLQRERLLLHSGQRGGR
jgi:hypothetical protein